MILDIWLLLKGKCQESNTIPDTSAVLLLAHCPGSETVWKKPKPTKTIHHGPLNSASFGQRLPGSTSPIMTFKEVTNKLFWTYNNINKSRYWL